LFAHEFKEATCHGLSVVSFGFDSAAFNSEILQIHNHTVAHGWWAANVKVLVLEFTDNFDKHLRIDSPSIACPSGIMIPGKRMNYIEARFWQRRDLFSVDDVRD